MENWQDPRPLFPWSAPPEHQRVRNAPKLKPNIYARMARFSVLHPVAILLILIFVIAIAGTILLLTWRVDLTKAPSSAPPNFAHRANTDFNIRFGRVDSVLRVRLSSASPDLLLPTARRLATQLRTRTGTVATVLVPELDATEPRFAPYYLATPELNRRVESVRSAQAYLQLLAASPTLGGLNGVLATAKGAADAGSTPAMLSSLLDAMATAANNLVEGKSSSIDWSDATGFSMAPLLPEIALLVVPADRSEANLLAQVQRDVEDITSETTAVSAQLENAGQGVSAGTAPSTGRQFVVALFLAVLFLISLFAIYLRSPRDIVLALLPPGAAVLAGMAVSVFIQSPLDSISAILPLLLVPGSVTIALCYVLALSRHEKRAISTMSLIMLAAQQSGAAAIAMMAVSLLLWLVWLSLAPIASPALAIGAAAGHAAAAATTLLVVPTFAALVPRLKPEFVPAAAAKSGRSWPLVQTLSRLRPGAAVGLLAATVICAITIVLDQGTAGSQHASQPLHLQATSYQSAAERIAALRTEESVGRILWIDDFLPTDLDAKRRSLALLSDLTLPVRATVGTPSNLLADQYAQLDETLRLLAGAAEQGKPLQLAAPKLRRSLALLATETGGAVQAGRRFEQVLVGSVQGLASYVAELAALAPPTASDLNPALRSLFLADDGTYRVEVWPRPPVSEREFTQVVRSVDPGAIVTSADSPDLSETTKWRFAIALLIACCGVLGLAIMMLGQLAAAIEFMLAQACTLLLFGGLATLSIPFPPDLLEVAVFSGLSVSAMAGLWQLLAVKNPWITPWSHLLGPLGGAAVALPLVLLSVTELAGFSRSFLLFVALVIIVQTVLAPQLSIWLAGLPRLQTGSSRKRRNPGNSQVSTSNKSGATTTSNAEPRQPPRLSD